MPHLLSYILLPGHDPDALGIAQHTTANLVVFDFEDLVPDGDKPKARLRVRSWLETEDLDGLAIGVRVNPWQSGPDRIDRSALVDLDLAHVVLPKVKTPSDLSEAKVALSEAGVGEPLIHVIIETPDALEAMADIARLGPASFFVGAFDLAKALDVEPNPNTTEIFGARQSIAAAAAKTGIAAYDMPFIHRTDLTGFEEHLAQAKYLGFTGCSAVNADQATRINEVFASD